MDAKEIVRAGYNKIASSYATARTADSADVRPLSMLLERLPKGAVVLDAGCGSGCPVTQLLARSFRVVGVDFAEEQIRLAKRRLPEAAFVCADLSSMPFKDFTFDAVCSYYAIIHIPRDEHSRVLTGFHRILREGGLAFLCMGAGDIPRDIDDYLGAQMYWSHYDSKKNLEMLRQCKFSILWYKTIEDPIDPPASHLFVLGQKE